MNWNRLTENQIVDFIDENFMWGLPKCPYSPGSHRARVWREAINRNNRDLSESHERDFHATMNR